MPRRRVLPPAAHHSAFLASDALGDGATKDQLRGGQLRAPTRGVRLRTDVDVLPAEVYRAYSRLGSDTYLSHTTAAHVWGIWLDPRHREGFPIHLTRTSGGQGTPRRKSAVGHRGPLTPADVRELQGIRLTSPSWTWTDLAGMGMGLDELVIAGDSLLQRADGPPRNPSHLGGNPLASLSELHETVNRRTGMPGITRARSALELVRPRVDSRPETVLRLLILRAGYPEPEVNVPVLLPNGRTVVPDLQFKKQRIALQYEGLHHAESNQLGKDIGRDYAFESIGWITVKADKAILHPHGEARFLERLAHAFSVRGILTPEGAWQ